MLELECFVAVAEEESFSKAARRMNLTQPPLSRHIRNLEVKVGCRLLERSTRCVKIVPAGELFLRDARRILSDTDSAVDAAVRAARGQKMRLRIGFVGALLDPHLVRLVQQMRKALPACQISLLDLAPSAQLSALEAGDIDAAFVGVAPETLPPRIRRRIWRKERFLLGLPASHPLANRQSVRISQLLQEPWILVSREAAPGFRHFMDRYLARNGGISGVTLESDRIAAVLTMVASGQGVTIAPASAAGMLKEGIVFREPRSPKPPRLDYSVLLPSKSDRPEVELLGSVLGSRDGKRA